MIITLCGSNRFEKEFHNWNKALTYSGHVVISLTTFPSVEGKKEFYTPQEKQWLDEAHKKKIEISDAIFVINKFAYIGESTMNEIRHAQSLGKEIIYLESWGKDYGIGLGHVEDHRQACFKEIGSYETSSPIDTFGMNPYHLLSEDHRKLMLLIIEDKEQKAFLTSDIKADESKLRLSEQTAKEAFDQDCVAIVETEMFNSPHLIVDGSICYDLKTFLSRFKKTTSLYSEPKQSIPLDLKKTLECPFPCGWNELKKLSYQRAAFLARATLEKEYTEEAIGAIHHNNQIIVRILDKICSVLKD